jgi:hypothetical protein
VPVALWISTRDPYRVESSVESVRSSVDFAGRTCKIKISAQEFSVKLGAANPRSNLIKAGVRVCLGTLIGAGKRQKTSEKGDYHVS